MSLFNYQSEAVERLVHTPGKHMLLAFEPGLGKTITSIAACDRLRARSVLVLCQSVGKAHWQAEFKRWQSPDTRRSVGIVHGTTQPNPGTDVVIANYDLVSRDTVALRTLLKAKWDVLILDEGHALKSTTSKRTRAVYGPRCDRSKGLAAQADRVWVLTGTPAPNHAGELYPHLRALSPELVVGPHGYYTEQQFIERYCSYRDTLYGRQITGSKNIAELSLRLTPFMLRKRKAEVLPDLPELRFDTLVVNPNDVKLVPQDLLRALGKAEVAAADGIAFAHSVAEPDDDTGLLTLLRQARTDEHLTTQRRLAGLVKAQIAIDLAAQELKGNLGTRRKLIMFAHHQQVIDKLMTGLRDEGLGAVKIDGRDTDMNKRQQAIEAFQTDPEVSVFVGQIQAAGTSITLTAASDVLFVEASWVPMENYQAACRAHRIGQKDGVLARFLTLDGSVDRQIMTALARKTREIDALIDKQTAPEITPAQQGASTKADAASVFSEIR